MEAQHPSGTSAQGAVVRTDLLTAAMTDAKSVARVEVKRVDMPPNRPSAAHLHPAPVVGLVLSGSILFQIAGQPASVLRAGDAFYEPAGVRVEHFDALEAGASFAACYLLGQGEDRLIEMLDEPR